MAASSTIVIKDLLNCVCLHFSAHWHLSWQHMFRLMSVVPFVLNGIKTLCCTVTGYLWGFCLVWGVKYNCDYDY